MSRLYISSLGYLSEEEAKTYWKRIHRPWSIQFLWIISLWIWPTVKACTYLELEDLADRRGWND